VLILMRADNNGEGGTLALMALASRALVGGASIVILIGVISGALFCGDAGAVGNRRTEDRDTRVR
jgi:KUP system potassium uptake protein